MIINTDTLKLLIKTKDKTITISGYSYPTKPIKRILATFKKDYRVEANISESFDYTGSNLVLTILRDYRLDIFQFGVQNANNTITIINIMRHC